MNEAKTEEPTPDPKLGKRRKKHPFLFWRILFGLIFLVWACLGLGVIGAGVLAFVIYDHVLQPGVPGPPVEVVVPAGASGRDVGLLLSQSGLIEYEGFFRLATRLDKSGKGIRYGTYELPKGLSATQLLKRLQEGPSRETGKDRVKVTIPEGLTIVQVAALFDDSDDFIKAAADADLIASLGIEAETLEGFLMPNTYFFDGPPSPREAVERMVAQFKRDYDRILAEIPGAEAYDKRSIATVASLVEEEMRADEERSKAAAVIYNRIEKGMPLQMDSTLQYALGKYGERMLYEDKEVDSPYNTYKHAGLPPGPISSPGVASLRAALAPAQADYIFFVSNADGRTHTFSSSAAEHQKAVARYRREIARQRREQASAGQ